MREPSSINILVAAIGKILSENRGKFLKEQEKRIFSAPLSNVPDTPLALPCVARWAKEENPTHRK